MVNTLYRTVLIGISLLLPVAHAWAVSLGEVRYQSKPGEKLVAEILIKDSSHNQLAGAQYKLYHKQNDQEQQSGELIPLAAYFNIIRDERDRFWLQVQSQDKMSTENPKLVLQAQIGDKQYLKNLSPQQAKKPKTTKDTAVKKNPARRHAAKQTQQTKNKSDKQIPKLLDELQDISSISNQLLAENNTLQKQIHKLEQLILTMKVGEDAPLSDDAQQVPQQSRNFFIENQNVSLAPSSAEARQIFSPEALALLQKLDSQAVPGKLSSNNFVDNQESGFSPTQIISGLLLALLPMWGLGKHYQEKIEHMRSRLRQRV